MIAQTHAEVACSRRVDDPPALLLARSHLERWVHLAVDEHDGAFAAEEVSERAAAVRRNELAGLREARVGDDEHEVVAEFRRVARILDDDRPVKAVADLRGRVRVRVIPIGSRVLEHEVVVERCAALDGRLRHARRAIHRVRRAHAVPVDRRGGRQGVLEVHDQALADARADQRPRNRAVVGPCQCLRARPQLDLSNPRFELDLDDRGIGIQVDGGRQRNVRIPPVGLGHIERRCRG